MEFPIVEDMFPEKIKKAQKLHGNTPIACTFEKF